MEQDISISALFLASKLCESPVRLRDLINTYLYLLARIQHLLDLPAEQSFHSGLLSYSDGREEDKVWEGFKFSVPGLHDEIFWDWKDVIMASEMQILKRLGFNMQVSSISVQFTVCSNTLQRLICRITI